jgi:hypothetical protein
MIRSHQLGRQTTALSPQRNHRSAADLAQPEVCAPALYGYPPKKAPKCGGDKVKSDLLPRRARRTAGFQQVENGIGERGKGADDAIRP